MNKKITLVYSFGCIAQILFVSVLVFFLRKINYEISYNTLGGIICIMIGGMSSALWGIIVSLKYKKRSLSMIIKDFFNVSQSIKSYILIGVFMLVDFSYLLLYGKLIVDSWYIPVLIFLKSLIFGGIEEIGWRYTFYPAVRDKANFIVTVVLTFAFWAIWHYLFFYIDGSLAQVHFFDFFTGLLTTCFILGMIFEMTESLWLCVFTHCFINTMSQTFAGGYRPIMYISRIVLITASVAVVLLKNKPHTEYNRG